jgi:glycosyltransferase involved in cell wall biosynthesis
MKASWEAICRASAPPRLAIHFTSVEERNESVARFPKALAVVIPNGVIVPPETVHLPSETLRLLTLGRLHPIKGIDNLIAACGELRDKGFGPFSLTLAGVGDRDYTAQIERRIAELSLGAVVTLAGEVRGEAKERLFAASDVLVAPSFRENFGNAIAEALAHGLPVIAGKGTPWSGLETHDAGLWVKNDAASLTAAITRAAAMPRAVMGARGRAWVTRDFGWERVADEMIAVYERLMRASVAPSRA